VDCSANGRRRRRSQYRDAPQASPARLPTRKGRLFSSSCPSVCIYQRDLPLRKFSWNLMLEAFVEICRENSNLLKSDKNIGALHVNTSCCRRHWIAIHVLLTLMCSTVTQEKRIFALPWQQWLRERVTVTLCVHCLSCYEPCLNLSTRMTLVYGESASIKYVAYLVFLGPCILVITEEVVL